MAKCKAPWILSGEVLVRSPEFIELYFAVVVFVLISVSIVHVIVEAFCSIHNLRVHFRVFSDV